MTQIVKIMQNVAVLQPYAHLTIGERKQGGVFYTPQYLAEYLAEKLVSFSKKDLQKRISLLDPACGNGILLEAFLKKISKKNKVKDIKICGSDIDEVAIHATQQRLSKFGSSEIIHADAITPVKNDTNKNGWLELKKNHFNVHDFNFIVSNPPWGAQLTHLDKNWLTQNFSLAKGQFDSFNLFTEIILENLANDGYYALILPDSVFNQEQWCFRKKLLDTKILFIARLGEKIFDEINRACTIIIGQKSKPANSHKVQCFRLTKSLRDEVLNQSLELSEAEKTLSHKVEQERFLQNDNYAFDIDLKASESNIITLVEKRSQSLSLFVSNTRGIELSKKGLVCECPKCKKWFPQPEKITRCPHCKHILPLSDIKTECIVFNTPQYKAALFKSGEDLFRFASDSKRWIDLSKQGINYKDLSLYKGEKILVRKTGVGITASLDYENAVTNQVVYVLKLNPLFSEKITLEFLLAVINSRFITYYLMKKYGETEWRTHPYLTQHTVKNLPIPLLDFTDNNVQEAIKDITYKVRNAVLHDRAKHISRKLDAQIEKTIAQLFGLTRKDYETIFKDLSEAEQLIPIKRLLTISIDDIFEN